MTYNDFLKIIEKTYWEMAKSRNSEPLNQWWPETQAAATTWVWKLVIEVAKSLDPKNERKLTFSTPIHAKKNTSEAEARENFFKKCGEFLHFEPSEVLLDFMVFDWESHNHIVLSAESEMYTRHGVGSTVYTTDGYSWDLYKLLLVPSPVRLFFARVGACYDDGETRRNQLCESIEKMLNEEAYAKDLLRKGDKLAIIILPQNASEWMDTRVLSFEKGKQLKSKKPWSKIEDFVFYKNPE